MKKRRTLLRVKTHRLYFATIALFVFALAVSPVLLTRNVMAATGQITTRSLSISSGVPSKSGVTYTFTFTLATAGAVQSMKFLACTTAVGTYPGGTCTAPTGMTAAGDGFDNAAIDSVNSTGWQGTPSFTVDATGANDCTQSPNTICLSNSDNTSQTATQHKVVFTTIKNPSTANTAFYVGMYTYSDATWTLANLVDFGATASAVTQTLTANAAVAEVLNFCVGSTTVNDASTSVAADCSAMTGTSVNIGTLDTSAINVSPINTNGGNNMNGVAMVRSNAGNGTVISYDAIQAATGTNHLGTLRITGGACDHPGSQAGYPTGGWDGTNDFTDPCINGAGTTQQTFNAGTEMFGMTIAGINYGSTTSYTCAYGGGGGDTCNMKPLTNYIGKGGSGTEDFCAVDCNTTDSGNGFAWDETGTAENIASSASSTVKQVDDEALILKFAATPSITTPFGPYSVQTDFIAVPTY